MQLATLMKDERDLGTSTNIPSNEAMIKQNLSVESAYYTKEKAIITERIRLLT